MHSEVKANDGRKNVLSLKDINWTRHLLSVIGTVLAFAVSFPFFVKAVIAKQKTFDSWGDTSDIPVNGITVAVATFWSIGYDFFVVLRFIILGYLIMIVFLIVANPVAKYFEPSFKKRPSFLLVQILCIICLSFGSKGFLAFASYSSSKVLFSLWGALIGYVACYTMLHVASIKMNDPLFINKSKLGATILFSLFASSVIFVISFR